MLPNFQTRKRGMIVEQMMDTIGTITILHDGEVQKQKFMYASIDPYM